MSGINIPLSPLLLLIISTEFPSRAKSLAVLECSDKKVLPSFLPIVEFFKRLASTGDNSTAMMVPELLTVVLLVREYCSVALSVFCKVIPETSKELTSTASVNVSNSISLVKSKVKLINAGATVSG